MARAIKSIGALTLALAISGVAALAHAASGGVKAGYLKCDVEGNVSFIFGSSRDLVCTYTPASGKRRDRYSGEIKKFGVDIGYQEAASFYGASSRRPLTSARAPWRATMAASARMSPPATASVPTPSSAEAASRSSSSR